MLKTKNRCVFYWYCLQNIFLICFYDLLKVTNILCFFCAEEGWRCYCLFVYGLSRLSEEGMFVCCLLFVVCCLLWSCRLFVVSFFFVCYLLCVGYCLLFVVCYLLWSCRLFVGCCLLVVVCCLLLVVCWLLFVVCCLLVVGYLFMVCQGCFIFSVFNSFVFHVFVKV